MSGFHDTCHLGNVFSLSSTSALDLQHFCTGHLSVLSSQPEADEMIKHSKEFKQEAVRIALTSGLPRDRVAIGKSALGKWVS